MIFDDESIIQGFSSVSDATSIRDEMEVNSEMLESSQRDSQVVYNCYYSETLLSDHFFSVHPLI